MKLYVFVSLACGALLFAWCFFHGIDPSEPSGAVVGSAAAAIGILGLISGVYALARGRGKQRIVVVFALGMIVFSLSVLMLVFYDRKKPPAPEIYEE